MFAFVFELMLVFVFELVGWALSQNNGDNREKMRTRQAAAVVGTKAGDNIDRIWKHQHSTRLCLDKPTFHQLAGAHCPVYTNALSTTVHQDKTNWTQLPIKLKTSATMMTTVMNGCEICWRYYFCGRFMWVGCHLKNQFEGILDSIVGPNIFLPPFMGSILRPSVACGACGFQAIPFGTTVEKLWAGGPPSMHISTFNLFNLTVFMQGWHPV